MQRLSSNLTLFFKFFVPVFWLVFFGALILALYVYKEEYVGEINSRGLRLGALAFYVTGALLFYFFLFPLKRVEADDDFLYATNYFKTFRYPWHNIERLEESRFAIFTLVTVVLKTPGYFGIRIRFLASNRLYRTFWEERPDLAAAMERSARI
ncbi:MAG: hypothetical protein KDC54_22115 [Lewinella sp.]|nr:hypothetical protein [Lewinella sp.]